MTFLTIHRHYNLNTKIQQTKHMNIEAIRSRLKPDELIAFNDALETAKPIVLAIEAFAPTTKDYYGDYLRWIISPMHALIFLCAGGNRAGIIAAAQINGIKF